MKLLGITNVKSMKTLNHSQNCILKLLELIDHPISAQNIWARLQNQGQKLGIATVYRNLEMLKLRGLVRFRTLHNESLYSLALGDQYFATCLQCGERIPLETNLSGSLKTQDLHSQSFQIYYHTLEVFGLCFPCKLDHQDA